MKKIICIILIYTLFSAFIHTVIFADSGMNWYIKRSAGRKPPIDEGQAAAIDAGSIYIGNGDEKVIYITFDAGYENGNVEKILDILKEKQVPAAFFVLKHLIVANRELVLRMHGDGHLVCNHTTNHKDMSALTKSEIQKNICELEAILRTRCGFDMDKFFRFPEGRYSIDAIRAVCEIGYKTVFWSFGYADWNNASQPAAQASLELILKNTHPGEIILLHPTSSTNVEILPSLIDNWRKMGYRFGTLNELTKEVQG